MPDALNNEWALYHQIFHTELLKRKYSVLEEDPTVHPLGGKTWDILYQFSEETAWFLYRRNTEDLSVQNDDIRIIADSLFSGMEKPEDDVVKEIVERCFALCGYWKIDPGRGFAEFYHNNIRDFFLCEKIMRKLDCAYRDFERSLHRREGEEYVLVQLLKELFSILQYRELDDRVLEFFRLRAKYLLFADSSDSPDECVLKEREHPLLPRIFQTVLLRGDLYPVCTTENPVQTANRVLTNLVGIFRQIYEAFPSDERGRIRWWDNVEKVNPVLSQLNGSVFKRIGPSNLSGVDLQKLNLSETDFRNANLQNAVLQDAILRDADLRDADLSGANLRGADLQRANLRGAVLRGADLQGAYLQEAHLEDAHLEDAQLQNARLQEAHLERACLQGVHLEKARLREAYMERADLRGADLQEADFSRADLRYADFREAKAQNAILQSAKLQHTNFQDAKMQGADLLFSEFSQTDFRGAKMQGAHMESSSLQNAKLEGTDLNGADIQGLSWTI